MRALIISQYLPPLKFIATVRITEVSNQFARNDFEVIGFSTNNHRYYPTDKFNLDERVRIIRSDSWDFLILRLKFKRFFSSMFGKRNKADQAESQVAQNAASGKPGLAVQMVYGLTHYLPFSLVFGDGSFIYILTTFFKALSFANKDTVVFTSYRSYSDLIIGYLIKLFCPQVYWICDFRDPHLPPNHTNVFFRIHAWINRRMCRRADVVTTVSKGVSRNLEGYNRRILVLRNGIVGSVSGNTGDVQAPEHFNIVYTGGLYNGTRNPAAIFRVLAQLIKQGALNTSRLRVVYAGPDKSIWDEFVRQSGLEKINESYGVLSFEESRKLQQSASINLLLTWADRNYKGVLTGKMYEYFKARKPIVTIINGDRDPEIEEIMKETKAGPVVYGDENSKTLINFIQDQYESFLNGNGTADIPEESLRAFQWDYYFPRFLEELGLKKPKQQIQHAI
ncbi:MAG: hypothetical protein ACJ75B_19195 [Flavisolibacter sp.]